MTMSKKVRNIIIFSVLGAVILAIGIYSLVTYLDYQAYRKSMEAAIVLISHFLRF